MRSYLYTLLITLSLTFTAGCEGIPKSGALQLKQNFILLRKDYKKYLDKDPRYEKDEEAKADRLGLIDDSVKLIDEALK